MKRGESGLSLLVGVDKPTALSSHDVVNRCRRIFGERRVGHTGTLDPLATGVLPICVGPATRLDRYMTGHDKAYRVTMAFGAETSTDDTAGEVLRTGPCPDDLLEGSFASSYIEGLVGEHLQLPPRYSAIKVGGKKAYELARKGDEAPLEPRPIRILEARLLERRAGETGSGCEWTAEFTVSKGTYIRSIVRDIGRELGCFAHVTALRRTRSGNLGLEYCHSLETLEDLGTQAALDPVRFLGLRYAFGDGSAKAILNGSALGADALALCEPLGTEASPCACCASGVVSSSMPPQDGEAVAVVLENRLKAIYRYDGAAALYRTDCVFSQPIIRG